MMRDNIDHLRERVRQLEHELIMLRSGIAYVVSQLNSTIVEVERNQRWYDESTDIERLKTLRNSIASHFTEDELKDVCFDLNVNPQSLASETLPGMARELVLMMKRQGRVDELVKVCKTYRPNVIY